MKILHAIPSVDPEAVGPGEGLRQWGTKAATLGHSVEVVTLLSQAQFGWALVTASVHLFGSLLLTMAGMWLTRWVLA